MADYETIQRRHNVAVGIFVVGALFAIVWLIFKFGDLPIKVSEFKSFKVHAQFPIAQGVQRNTPVRFCGYQIGRVTNVQPPKILKDRKTGQFYHQAIVVLSIDRKYDNIPSNADVKLMTRGLGSSYIELVVDPEKPKVPLDPNRPETSFLLNGMWLQGSTGMTSEFFPAESQKKLEEMVDGLSALINNANDILGDPNNKENLRITLANMSEATKQATQALKEFQKFSAAGTETLKNTDAKIEKAVVAMVGTSEELGKTTAQLRVILEKINTGQGTAAKLINDGRFYENLLDNTQEMQMLLEELRLFVAESRDKGLPIKLK